MKRAILAILILSFFSLWLLFADRFFDSSPDGLTRAHENGFAAAIEQIGVSLYSPAYFAWLGYDRIYPNPAVIDRGPLFILCVLQLWPLAVLIFRPWPQLSRTFRRVIFGYSAACVLVTVCGFFLLRHLPLGTHRMSVFLPTSATPNKTDAGNGSEAICRVNNVLRSPSPDPRRSPNNRAAYHAS